MKRITLKKRLICIFIVFLTFFILSSLIGYSNKSEVITVYAEENTLGSSYFSYNGDSNSTNNLKTLGYDQLFYFSENPVLTKSNAVIDDDDLMLDKMGDLLFNQITFKLNLADSTMTGFNWDKSNNREYTITLYATSDVTNSTSLPICEVKIFSVSSCVMFYASRSYVPDVESFCPGFVDYYQYINSDLAEGYFDGKYYNDLDYLIDSTIDDAFYNDYSDIYGLIYDENYYNDLGYKATSDDLGYYLPITVTVPDNYVSFYAEFEYKIEKEYNRYNSGILWWKKTNIERNIYEGVSYSPIYSIKTAVSKLNNNDSLDFDNYNTLEKEYINSLLSKVTYGRYTVKYLEPIPNTPFAKKVVVDGVLLPQNLELSWNYMCQVLGVSTFDLSSVSQCEKFIFKDGVYEAEYLESFWVSLSDSSGNVYDVFTKPLSYEGFYRILVDKGILSEVAYNYLFNSILESYDGYLDGYTKNTLYGLFGYGLVPKSHNFDDLFSGVFSINTSYSNLICNYYYSEKLNYNSYKELISEDYDYNGLQTVISCFGKFLDNTFNGGSVDATHYFFFADKTGRGYIAENGAENEDELGDTVTENVVKDTVEDVKQIVKVIYKDGVATLQRVVDNTTEPIGSCIDSSTTVIKHVGIGLLFCLFVFGLVKIIESFKEE